MRGATAAAEATFSGMRSLSGVLEQQQVVRAARAASLAETADDYLFSIAHDGRVVEHRITKWSAKRVYYVHERIRYRDPSVVEYLTSPDRRISPSWVERDGDSVIWVIVGYANRAALERDGETATLTGYPYPQHVVFDTREAAEAIAHGDIKQLRRQMASVHPDRGGTAEQFIAARKRYERALAAARRTS